MHLRLARMWVFRFELARPNKKKHNGHAAYHHHRILRITCNLIMKSRLWRADGMRDMWHTPFQNNNRCEFTHFYLLLPAFFVELSPSIWHNVSTTHTHTLANALHILRKRHKNSCLCVGMWACERVCACVSKRAFGSFSFRVFVFNFFSRFVCVTVITVECLKLLIRK